MKKYLLLIILSATAAGAFAQDSTTIVKDTVKAAKAVKVKKVKVKPSPLKKDIDSVSYALGMSIAKFYKEQGLKSFNNKMLTRGIEDVLKDKKSLLNEEEINMSISNYLQKLKAEKAMVNKKAGQAFLDSNKTKPGVITLPSGLQYIVITQGAGPKPIATDKVKCHYHGTLIDGTVFDSSVDRGQPVDFPVNGVIKGWVEALQLMPVGSKWKLFIPADLAYGDNQAGPTIKPGSTLVFDVELIAIVK